MIMGLSQIQRVQSGVWGYGLYLPKSFTHHTLESPARHFIYRVIEIAGVTDWSRLVGETIRVWHNHGIVWETGHIIDDDWFCLAKDFEILTQKTKDVMKMLISRLEIRNIRKIKQVEINFHGPGVQVIEGINQSGKTTIGQTIAITMNGTDFTQGMIRIGEEEAEIIADTDNELKIRMVIAGSMKQKSPGMVKIWGSTSTCRGCPRLPRFDLLRA
jgi:hypothetical protein